MINGTQTLFDLAEYTTKIVSDRGLVVARAQVKERNEALTTARLRIARLIAWGRRLEEVLATKLTQEFEARWGNPKLFLGNVWAGMNRRVQELGMSIV